jgi:hypothetical protein
LLGTNALAYSLQERNLDIDIITDPLVCTKEPLLKGRLSTINLPINIGYFVKKKKIVLVGKAAVLNMEVYCTDPSPSRRIPWLAPHLFALIL